MLPPPAPLEPRRRAEATPRRHGAHMLGLAGAGAPGVRAGLAQRRLRRARRLLGAPPAPSSACSDGGSLPHDFLPAGLSVDACHWLSGAVRGRRANALMLAASAGAARRVRALRAYPWLADPAATNASGRNAFHAAATGACVRALVAPGPVDPDADCARLLAAVRAGSSDGSTPLHYAASRPAFGSDSPAAALLEFGADPRQRNAGGCIPLHFVATAGCCRLLLAAGGDDSANERNSYGDTALHISCSHGYADVVLELLRAGADVTIASRIWHGQIPVSRMVRQLQAAATDAEEKAALGEVRMLLGEWSRVMVDEDGGGGGRHGGGAAVATRHDRDAGALAKDDDAARARHPYDKTHLRRLAWMGLRTLCRRPQDQVARATGLPPEIVEEVVSVYLGADILFDAATGDNVGRRGSSASVPKGMCVVS